MRVTSDHIAETIKTVHQLSDADLEKELSYAEGFGDPSAEGAVWFAMLILEENARAAEALREKMNESIRTGT